MNTRAKHQVNGNSRPENRHTVVLGGSLAGLLAARVLSDHFEHVTLIERDVYPETVSASGFLRTCKCFRLRARCSTCTFGDISAATRASRS